MAICPIGYFCPEGSPLPLKCPVGYFCPNPGMSEKDEQFKCAPGVYCIAGASSRNDFQNHDGTIECPAGFYCLEGTTVPTMCPAGTYSDKKGLESEGQCDSCEPGYVCYQGQTSYDINDCPLGFFCPLGTGDAYITNGALPNGDPNYELYCPPGHSCKGGIKTACHNGEYQHQYGQLSCEICPAGYFCENNPDGIVSPQLCDVGSFCPKGSSSQNLCGIGSYGHATGLMSEDQCALCPVGKYCDTPGETNPTNLCDEHFFCEPGAINEFGKQSISGLENPCAEGNECPPGTTSMIKCKAGYYNNNVQQSCDICDEDFFCPYSGTVEPSPCVPGFTCPNSLTDFSVFGENSNTYLELLPDGGTADYHSFPCPLYHECPTGKIADMKICDPEFYSDEFGTIQCKPCPPGFTCLDGKITDLCPRGKYCRSGEPPYPCPTGYYNPNEGSNLESGCPSPSGQDDDCAIDTGKCIPCPAGSYCNNADGTSNPTFCDAGYFCTQRSNNRRQNSCPAGHYCPRGSGNALACPVGTYNTESEQVSISACLPCPEGKYCDKTGISDNRNLPSCASGYYCGIGSFSDRPGFISNQTNQIFGYCQEGQYCPGDEPAPLPCEIGTFTNLTHQSKCEDCPRGYFCNGSDHQPEPCSVGHICVNGVETLCPERTFNPSQYGYSEKDHCLVCTPGYTCADPTSDPVPCDTGKYCINGEEFDCSDGNLCQSASDEEEPCSYGKTCNNNIESICQAEKYCEQGIKSGEEIPCPAGSYCAAGSKYPVQCEPGTYSNQPELSSDLCQPCTRGYCPKYGSVDDTSFTVLDGYFCDGDCGRTATPKNCSVGAKCIGGVEILCDDPSEFQPLEGQSECFNCGPGFKCDDTFERIECSEGTYCADGINLEQSCYEGSFGYFMNHGASDFSTACNDCPAGHLCSSQGLTKSDVQNGFFCTDGIICKGGNDTELCAPGSYCPALNDVLITTNMLGKYITNINIITKWK